MTVIEQAVKESASAGGSSERLKRLLEEARKRLVDTGTRNRLVHTNRKAKRPSTLALLHPDADALFRRIVDNNVSFRFLADPAATERERRRESDEASEDVPSGRLHAEPDLRGGDVFQTRLGEAGLEKKLTRLAREAKTLEEEQGINILFLALGFLRWYEDETSSVEREAPLILVPVSLVRDVRRSTYTLRAREEHITTNLPLAERLRDQENLNLPEIDEGEGWLPSSYFDKVEQAVANRGRWSIDRSGRELGFFSFAKLLMFGDLAAEAWPNASILTHPLLRCLMQDGFTFEDPLFPDNTKIDEKFQPADLLHVLDADGSQTLAIETVRAGRNVVIQGPPGTGKSQTIANIIAAAAHDGKSVLFIAEKMVALGVVHDRLKKTGLGPLCLGLHSRLAHKRAVAEELAKTLTNGAVESGVEPEAARLTEVRDALNRIDAHLQAPLDQTETSAFRAIGDLVRAHGLCLPPPSTPVPNAETWRSAEYKRILETICRYASTIRASGHVGNHPWRDVKNEALQPIDLTRIERDAPLAAKAVRNLRTSAEVAAGVFPGLGCLSLAAVGRLRRFLDVLAAAPSGAGPIASELCAIKVADLSRAGECIREAVQLLSSIDADSRSFRATAFIIDISECRTPIFAGSRSFLKRWQSAYRSASLELGNVLIAPLPKTARERLALIDLFIELKARRNKFEELCTEGRGCLGAYWEEAKTDWSGVGAVLDWLLQVRSEGFDFDLARAIRLIDSSDLLEALRVRLAEHEGAVRRAVNPILSQLDVDLTKAFGVPDLDSVPFDEIALRLDIWATHSARYNEWRNLADADRILRTFGLGEFANRIANGEFEPESAVEALRHARAEALWKLARERNPLLKTTQNENRTALVSEFQRLDTDRRRLVAALIRARHSAEVPRGAMGNMAMIRGEIARRRGHMPIRKLLKNVGRTIQKIKPVFLMSPISVAQFLPPGALEFDLLVIDEASQVRPEDALGVIARAKQMVVVGDAKQLPPTNFFNRVLSDDDEAENDDYLDGREPLVGAAKVAELESILTLCEARGVGSKMLRWHYRSRHPSLIEVSNEAFYEHSLFLPPSPVTDREGDGLTFVRVAGVYDRGGKRTNEIEGKAIVEALIAHARRYPGRSIGVVTFSTAQRDLITNFVEDARRREPALDEFVSDQPEEVFVKNLENVQGDERDHIIVSIGYGPRIPNGRLDSMSFGPVTSDGGPRRLNVLFTRARYRCEVFCSFDPGDINTDRAKSEGVRILKRYLDYAQTGILNQSTSTGEDHDSPFEEDVARVVGSFGFTADPQVGTAGFKIDLGVRDPSRPGRYILAIECDGATYHSALWARERDRLRQEILEGQGWRFHRVWSTDWFYRRSQEIERLKTALDAARVGNAQIEGQSKPIENDRPEGALAPSPPPSFTSMPYVVASFPVGRGEEPHEVSLAQMAIYVKRIVDIEGPIHEEEIARRVADLFGKERAGSRIQLATKVALKHLLLNRGDCECEGAFWFTGRQESAVGIRDRINAPMSLQHAAMLPPLEIRSAILKAVEQNGAVVRDDLPVAAARLFGFRRTGAELKGKIDQEVARLLDTERLEIDGELVRPARLS